MSSSRPKRAPISESLPCPECGQMQMARVVETCHLEDGVTVKRLGHYKCQACGARFFDDEAMHAIQAARSATAKANARTG